MPSGLPLSLLWPDGRASVRCSRLSDAAVADLQLPRVIAALIGSDAPGARLAAREAFARDVLTELVWDTDIIRYRQAVLDDLLNNPSLREGLEAVLPSLEALGDVRRGERYRPTSDPGVESIIRRLAELELLVDVVVRTLDALHDIAVMSDGFRTVHRHLQDQRSTSEFASLERELPTLRATLQSARSVTLGVNLGADLTPESATILDVSAAPIEGRRALLWRLLGGSAGKEALTPLQRGEGGPLGRPNELVRDLRHLLGQVVAPIQAALDRFTRVSSAAVGQLGAELALLLGMVRLIERVRRTGLAMCRPRCAGGEERSADLTDAYDLVLALDQLSDAEGVVTNHVQFDNAGRVWVLTGPNRAGKTTYVRAVGLTQILFQAGMYAPASSARLSPADTIFTHFPGREETRPGLGRLDTEAERLAAIFHQATPRSLILLNEALSGTSALEALDLARGLVRGLRLLGARAIYVTHLHELGNYVDDINATTPGDGAVASLLADSTDDGSLSEAPVIRRTFRIVPGAPRGISYAAEIAREHGISFDQLARLLQDRGLTSKV